MSSPPVSAIVRAMVTRGCTNAEIFERLGKTNYVNVAISRARNPRAPAQCGYAGSTDAMSKKRDADVHRRWSWEQARAGIMHLVDLKRAGHSPRFTEYNILPDSEYSMGITRPPPAMSFCGSPSAWASES